MVWEHARVSDWLNFFPSWRDAANVIMVNERVANLINEILIKEGAADATVIEKGAANVMVMSELERKRLSRRE